MDLFRAATQAAKTVVDEAKTVVDDFKNQHLAAVMDELRRPPRANVANRPTTRSQNEREAEEEESDQHRLDHDDGL